MSPGRTRVLRLLRGIGPYSTRDHDEGKRVGARLCPGRAMTSQTGPRALIRTKGGRQWRPTDVSWWRA